MDLLFTTRELFSSYLNGRKYCIPAYQRGYKWDSGDIVRLLEDINDFEINDDADLFYCLQNITVIEKGNVLNVVDGQQRLTTLTIILSYLKEFDLIDDALIYDVRHQTKQFIDEWIYKPGAINRINTWDDFLDVTRQSDCDYDYQDIYYLFNAYKTVQNWFAENTAAEELMKNKILNHVKMIVNLTRNVDEHELFENLNGKRVPLDGADLVRAMIITRVAKKEASGIGDRVKRDVLINELRVKIGMQLDAINQWWCDENRREYFHIMSKEASVASGAPVVFNEKVSPVNILYKLYALAYADGTLSVDLFEKHVSRDRFLTNLITLQRTLTNWYNDALLYHLILYTMIYASARDESVQRLSFRDLYYLWQQCSRKEFVGVLRKRIAANRVINDLLTQHDIPEEEIEAKTGSENWFDDKSALSAVVVLLDIISLLSSPMQAKLPAKYFSPYKEDSEHIFPQAPIGDRIKDKNKQTQILRQYISIINHSSASDERIELNNDEVDWDNQEWRESIKSLINERIKKIIPINSLGNLCLLHESVNRGYGNDFFLEKRIDVMRAVQKGIYIRPHVYDAFNKVYAEREKEVIDTAKMTKWDSEDVALRRRYIISQIHQFLNDGKA